MVSNLCLVGWHWRSYPMKHRTFMKELCDTTNDFRIFTLRGRPLLNGGTRAYPRGEAPPTTRRKLRSSKSFPLGLFPPSMLRLAARAPLRLRGIADLLNVSWKRGGRLLRRLSLTSRTIVIKGALVVFKAPRSLRVVPRSCVSRFFGASPSLHFPRAGFVHPRLL